MRWTRESFAIEARDFVRALQNSDIENFDEGVASWKLVDNRIADALMLQHSPVWRLIGNKLPTETDDGFDDSYDDFGRRLDCDDELRWDVVDLVVDDPMASNPWISKMNDGLVECKEQQLTVWDFSVVFSDTWECPVLFFRVERLDGSLVLPFSRELVIEALKSVHHQNQVTDSWEFVSWDEHPILHVPSFYLHPCQTQERMKILLRKQTTADVPIVVSTVGECAASEAWPHEVRSQQVPSGFHILSWMSMILPAVGLSIKAKDFVSIRERLIQLQQESNGPLL